MSASGEQHPAGAGGGRPTYFPDLDVLLWDFDGPGAQLTPSRRALIEDPRLKVLLLAERSPSYR